MFKLLFLNIFLGLNTNPHPQSIDTIVINCIIKNSECVFYKYSQYFIGDSLLENKFYFYQLYVNSIFKEYKLNGRYKIFRYDEVRSKIKGIDMTPERSALYVARLQTKSLRYVHIFFKLKEDKVYSIVPLTKGGVLIGWV